MNARRRMGWAGLAAVVLVGCHGNAEPDNTFDVSVSRPAYATTHPRVLFDEAHHNYHTSGGRYQPFVRLLRHDGFAIARNAAPFSREALAHADILVVANAQGTNERNDASAFTPSECDAVREWVRHGGALLLITDHYPMGPPARHLSERFGVEMSGGDVEDSLHYDVASGDRSQLVFTRAESLIVDHPITRGRLPAERIDRVMTFTGQSLAGPPGSVGFLRLSATAVNRAADVRVEKQGGDVRVIVTPGLASPAMGWSQGVALEFGKGRVVVLGEAAMLTAQRQNGRSFGMQFPGTDNRQLALNVMHWLSGLLVAPGSAPHAAPNARRRS